MAVCEEETASHMGEQVEEYKRKKIVNGRGFD